MRNPRGGRAARGRSVEDMNLNAAEREIADALGDVIEDAGKALGLRPGWLVEQDNRKLALFLVGRVVVAATALTLYERLVGRKLDRRVLRRAEPRVTLTKRKRGSE